MFGLWKKRTCVNLLVLLLVLGGLAGAAWTGYDTATKKNDWKMMVHRERELRTLLPHIKGLKRIGYTAWNPHVYRTQYTLVPTYVVRFSSRHEHHLVELRPGEKLNLKPATWQVVARSPRGQFVLLKKRKGR